MRAKKEELLNHTEEEFLQTEMKTEAASDHDKENPDAPVPVCEPISQTDPEPIEKEAIAGKEPAEFSEPSEFPQTDPEIGTGSKDHAQNPETNEPVPQTDPEIGENSEHISSDAKEETTPKKTRGRKKKTEESANASGRNAPNESPSETTKRHSAKTDAVISIDQQRSVETETDREKNDLLDLLESQKTGHILTGTIQGVERTGDNRSCAVIYHGAFKVLLPAAETVTAPEDFRDRKPEDVYHYLLTKRLGAEVDYIVKGIDPLAGVAVGSRLDAMKAKRKQFYFGLDREGNNILYPGVCAEARVVSVIRAGIFVDLFGLEVYMPLRELSYQRMLDAAGYFHPGQRILVKILALDRSDKNDIRVQASVKQASENPYEKALRRYTVGNRYVGTVSMVDTNGVFVALDGGIDCLCSYPKRGRPPRGARVTVRVLGINRETNRIWGAITHTAISR